MSEPGNRLVGEWAVCGIAAAAARFVPVPLLDDAIRHRATQIAVVRTLRANGRTYSSGAVEALFAGVEAGERSVAQRALAYLRRVPRRLLLFPVRKYVALFGSVRGVPNDVMTVLLLARTVHRSLEKGRLPEGADEAALRDEAVVVRRAFDESVHRMDLRLLTGALGDALSQGRELSSAAVRFARGTLARVRKDDDDDAGDALAVGGPVGEGAQQVEQVLRRPEIARLLAEFDQQVDERLAGGR